MVETEFGSLTEQRTTETVFWTRFSTEAFTDVNWDDPEMCHRQIMRLFNTRLVGNPRERREKSGILYRVDVVDGLPIVTVQSWVAPELLPAGARMMEVPKSAWTIETGAQVVFRVAVNPIKRSGKNSGHRERLAKDDELVEWIESRLGATVSDLNILSHLRDVVGQRTKQDGSKGRILTVDTFDCSAVVSDSAQFEALRRNGVGRSKSYGCGLLTAQKID